MKNLRWVRVEDELPPDYELVWIYDGSFNFKSTEKKVSLGFYTSENKTWYAIGGFTVSGVKFWFKTNRPQPPEGE